MDYSLVFSLLLYVNIFYFGLYAFFEFFLLIFKTYNLPPSVLMGPYYADSTSTTTHLINNLLLLTFMVVCETARLLIGHQNDHQIEFDKHMNSVFHILVLTAPSMYAVTHFTLWQGYVTRLEAVLGCVMLVIQASQFISCFLGLWYDQFSPEAKQRRRMRGANEKKSQQQPCQKHEHKAEQLQQRSSHSHAH